MIIYSNSCSYGEPQEHAVYADIIADFYQVPLINSGIASSCNRRIIRTSLRELEQLGSSQITALIGLTFISRTELWQPHLPATKNDGHFHSIKIDDSKLVWPEGLINSIVPDVSNLVDPEVKDYYKHWLAHYNPEPVLTDLITDIIMFAGWCKNKNIKLVVFNNAEFWPQQPEVGLTSPFLYSLIQTMLQEPAVIDPWAYSFVNYSHKLGFEPKDKDRYGIHGHPGPEAHQAWANFLLRHLDAISIR